MKVENEDDFAKITLESEDSIVIEKVGMYVLAIYQDEEGYEAKVAMTREELKALRDLIGEIINPTQLKLDI